MQPSYRSPRPPNCGNRIPTRYPSSLGRQPHQESIRPSLSTSPATPVIFFFTVLSDSSSSPSSQNDNLQEASVLSSRRKRKFTSPIWDHYNIHPSELYPDRITRTICISQLSNNSSLNRKIDPFIYKERIALATIQHAYPFTNTLKNYCMKIHRREKKNLLDNMSVLPGKICLTTDMWTVFVGVGYLSLTAHYIDSEWNLHSKILNFCHLEPPHDALEIQRKIFTITLDNARCNNNMQVLLLNSLSLHSFIPCDGEYFYVRYGAHVLNLIVQDGLKVIDNGVRKLRMVIGHIVCSERRILRFKENAIALAVDCSRKLSLDCSTRWNSTYKMLVSAFPYKTVFPTMRRPEMQRFDPHFPEPPTNEEWYANFNDEYIKDMAKRMRVKFDKYWKNYSLILSFAAILDPRYKLPFIKYCFHELEPETAELKTKFVKDIFYEMFEEYVKKSPRNPMHTNGFADFDGGVAIGGRSSLDLCLDDARLEHTLDIDVLIWWKENEPKFPIVAQMARDILAIPITTVASESAFSMGSRILTKWRASLHPTTADALLTTRAWLSGFEVREGEEERQDVDGLEIQLSNMTINNEDTEDEGDEEVDEEHELNYDSNI
ncbi:hypothetical protein RND81_04G113700 [Saponaria officinalis]|uniref:Transposase n=1 Tax=Saponaria officinalis TaxID=3572 RepID=A0AAW1LGP9_SAPOF